MPSILTVITLVILLVYVVMTWYKIVYANVHVPVNSIDSFDVDVDGDMNSSSSFSSGIPFRLY